MNQRPRGDYSSGAGDDRVTVGPLSAPLPTVTARPDEVQRVVRLVSDGLNVEVVGSRRSGRTQLLGFVRAALVERGVDVLAVSGVGALLPLEAVSAVLPPVYRDMVTRDQRSTVAIRDALVEFLTEGQTVVMVDDADHLDDASWSILLSACNLVGRPIVASRLRRARTEAAPNSLGAAGRPVVHVSLGELRLEEVHAVLEDRLEGTLSPSVSARIHTDSAGVPGLAVALLDGAIADGLVRRAGDQWTAAGDLWSEDGRDAYESLLGTYRPPLRDAVELLAVVGAVDLTVAWLLLGEELVEELEGYDLARLSGVGAERRFVLAVHPPGLGDFHRHEPQSARRRRIVAHAVDRLQQAPAEVDTVEVQRALARLLTSRDALPAARARGGRVQDVDVPVVAGMFADTYAVEIESARARWEAEQDYPSAIHYLQVQLSGRNDPEEVERVLAVVDGFPRTGSVDEVRLRHVRARLALAQGVPAEEVAAALVDGAADDPAHLEVLDTLARSVRWEMGALDPGYARVLEPRAARGGFDGRIASIVLASCHLMAGRPDDALRVADAVEWEVPPAERVGIDVLRGLALYASGRFAEVWELARTHVQTSVSARDRLGFAAYSYLGALAQIALGRLDEAQDSLAVVLSSGISSGLLTFSPDKAILVAMTVISSRTGHQAAAAGFLEHARQVLGTTDSLPLGSTAWAEAVVLEGRDEPEAAAETFAALVVDLRERGYAFAADVATMFSLTTRYDPGLAAEFRERAGALGGPVYLAALDAREAALAGDALAVELAAHRLQDGGAGKEALTYLTLAARLYRDQGDADRVTAVKEAVRGVADTLGISERAMAALDEPDFTAREREVIRLVAAGLSNYDIATELFVGVRTVESHLRNIRRKSGVAGRKEIGGFA